MQEDGREMLARRERQQQEEGPATQLEDDPAHRGKRTAVKAQTMVHALDAGG
jgi:hypothetical protein